MSHSSTHHGGASHGSVKSYIVGFILSVILTVIPFWMVMHPGESHTHHFVCDCRFSTGADSGAAGVFLTHEFIVRRWMEPDRVCVYGADHRYFGGRLVVDHVPPQYQYDGSIKSG